MLPMVAYRMPPNSFTVKTPYCANLTLLPLVATCLRPTSFLACVNEYHCMDTSFLVMMAVLTCLLLPALAVILQVDLLKISLAICTTSLLTSFVVMMLLCTDPLLTSLVANIMNTSFLEATAFPTYLLLPALAVISRCGRCADSTGGATVLANPLFTHTSSTRHLRKCNIAPSWAVRAPRHPAHHLPSSVSLLPPIPPFPALRVSLNAV
ncbi:unnamed protein product [Prorocentrum cordatum]|uniref:Uncharacterized protein n=1 Tax=Prorocentrum cordatum TaxID=2364126 RepID=A0ABN9QUY3_9DINO|nr:unnamed protein product [Polarella glacialis]